MEAVEKFIGQFVRHIEPPARRAEPEPVPRNAVFAGQKRQHARIGLIELRQDVNAPPAGVIVRPATKIIPRTVGRIFVAICTLAAVRRKFVKISAVGARVAEHAVEQNFYPVLFRTFAEGFEILLCAEHRVDFHVVARVVSVVRARGENRVQIYAGDAEALEIAELLFDALEVAAEKVVFFNFSVEVGLPVGLFAPAGVIFRRGLVLGQGSFAGAAEPVREYLIHCAAAKPQGRVAVFAAYGQPPARALADDGVAFRFK